MSKKEHANWDFVGPKPWTRKDGTQTTLIVWRRPCRTCGVPFEVSTGARGGSALDLVNCPQHREKK